MCGIAGLLGPPPRPGHDIAAVACRMADALALRGPDDSGEWTDASAGIALSHRRLSIVDLSPQGHQPMHSASGRYVISFNGEIYNFEALRDEIERSQADVGWRGHSDTEVMLAAFERWGVDSALKRCVGMFALALWDRQERVLHLARDRFGEKPLYYGWAGDALVFGSELKALRAHPDFDPALDQTALGLYMQVACVPAPWSIHAHARKLPPGCVLSFGTQTIERREAGELRAYWSFDTVVQAGALAPFEGSDRDAADELERLLGEAVAGQMVADVPLGAFLSGGVDSSTVVAMMQAVSDRPARTFSIGFAEHAYDEASFARQVAQHLGTCHTELYVSAEEALATVPRMPSIYDEPFGDSSQIPTLLVSQLARRHVTVSLSGDAGDELFAGYNRYAWALKLHSSIGWMPRAGREAVSALATAISPQGWDAAYGVASVALPQRMRHKAAGDKVHKLAGLLRSDSDAELYRRLVSFWPVQVVVGEADQPPVWSSRPLPAALRGAIPRMMYLDTLGYLPDDILVKVDRAAMSVSLETRVPLLDHRLVEFAWRLPLRMKLRDGQSKWLLRQVLYRHVPRELIERPKMGFSIPLDAWLRGPLRDWAEALLDEARLKREAMFDAAAIRRKWGEHLSGARNWQHHLWVVLMFQAWIDHWQGPAASR